MAQNTVIQIRVAGTDIAPGTVRSKEIAEVITAVEDMIAALVVRTQPEIKKDDIVIGLVDIQKGSLLLNFNPAVPEHTLPAFSTIANAIVTNRYKELPSSARDDLSTLASFSKRRHCNIELRTVGDDETTLATITPDLVIEAPPLILGWTTIYGRVVRVGGKDPKVGIELPGGGTIYCDINDSLARRLGYRLYTWVGLSGRAKWDNEEFFLQEFSVDEITAYEESSIVETFQAMRDLAGPYFDAIDDVDAYVNDVRDSEED